MYLNSLNEKQKHLFLKLAFSLAHIDGEYSPHEENLLKAYCSEMNIKFDTSMSVDSIHGLQLEILETYDCNSMRVICFELVGLALTDEKFDNAEKEFIGELVNLFGLDISLIDECSKLISEYILLQKKINSVILN